MRVLLCTEYNVDAQSCVGQQVWSELPSAIPPLSIADALEISGAIALVWGTAYGLRLLARFIWPGK